SRERRPKRSARAPVRGAERADAKVRKPRNSPAWNREPPRDSIRKGAVGSSMNADRKTAKVKAHMTKKRGEKSGSRGPAMGAIPAPPMREPTQQEERRSPRVLRRVALKVTAEGNTRDAETAIVNRHGALLLARQPYAEEVVLEITNLESQRK